MGKILIVEDNPGIAQAYSILLEKEGHQVATAGNGDEALSQADSFQPDLILLDLMMPQATGLDFLKAYQGKGNAVVYVMTNMPMLEMEMEASKLGAKKYLIKSNLSPGEIAEMIKVDLPA